jgi:hypothetical protein
MDTFGPHPTSPLPPDTSPVTQHDLATAFRPWDPAAAREARLPVPSDEDPLDPIFTEEVLRSLIEALPHGPTDTPTDKLRRKVAAMHLLRSLDAQQPVEAALAAQAVLFHHATMAAGRRAARTDPPTESTAAYETATAARASTLFCHLVRELERKQFSQTPRVSRSKPRWRG